VRARIVDTSELEPPEPMQVVLAELDALAEDEYLVMRHRREPVPLYVILAARCFRHQVRPGTATPIEVVIWRERGPVPDEGPA
jgi:hypothetical protein